MTDTLRRLLAPMLLASAVFWAPQAARAQPAEATGKEVVEALCANCHASGAKGAPKIGDQKAWSKRASQGLTSLTQSALNGIRAMPAHGGSPKLTDLEIGRAVAYMVNQSGGNWVEPASAKDMAAERSGADVVKTQCAKCHEKGIAGAPRIGDRAAWAPRLKNGVDSAARSAIRGHGGMPPRGDKADLTDAEIKSAINYMFNPAAEVPAKAAPAPQPRSGGPMHRSIGGLEVYLGIQSADVLRARQASSSADAKMYGGVPGGKDYFLVNVTLRDSGTNAEIKDAQVEAHVASMMSSDTRKLESATINGVVSYGGYFQLRRKVPYALIFKIVRPGAVAPVETQFEFKR